MGFITSGSLSTKIHQVSLMHHLHLLKQVDVSSLHCGHVCCIQSCERNVTHNLVLFLMLWPSPIFALVKIGDQSVYLNSSYLPFSISKSTHFYQPVNRGNRLNPYTEYGCLPAIRFIVYDSFPFQIQSVGSIIGNHRFRNDFVRIGGRI